MTRQEEIRNGLLQIVSEYGLRVLTTEGKAIPVDWRDKILSYLHSQGVVIMIDGNCDVAQCEPLIEGGDEGA